MLVAESTCRGSTYVEDAQLTPQRPPDDIAALRTALKAIKRVCRTSSLYCGCIISDPITLGSIVFDIAEDLVRARVGIEGGRSLVLD